MGEPFWVSSRTFLKHKSKLGLSNSIGIRLLVGFSYNKDDLILYSQGEESPSQSVMAKHAEREVDVDPGREGKSICESPSVMKLRPVCD